MYIVNLILSHKWQNSLDRMDASYKLISQNSLSKVWNVRDFLSIMYKYVTFMVKVLVYFHFFVNASFLFDKVILGQFILGDFYRKVCYGWNFKTFYRSGDYYYMWAPPLSVLPLSAPSFTLNIMYVIYTLGCFKKLIDSLTCFCDL